MALSSIGVAVPGGVRRVLVAAALVVGMTSCSDVDSSENSSGTSDAVAAEPGCGVVTGPGTVQFWHTISGNVTLDALDDLAAGLAAELGTTLEFRRFDSDEQLLEAFALAAPADRPDLVLVTEQATRSLVDSGNFVPPVECDPTFADDVLPQVAAPYSDRGELMAAPFGVSVPVLMFDAARFEAAGLNPAVPPRTLDELLEASLQITTSGVAAHGLVITDSCAATVVEQYSAQRGQLLGDADNGRTARLRSVDLVSAPAIAALTAVRDAVWAEHVQYLGSNDSGFDNLVAITRSSGGGVMTLHTSGALGEVIALLEGGNFPGIDLGVGPLPGPGAGSLIGGNALWLTRSADAARVARGWSAVEWMTRPDVVAAFAAVTGYVPGTASAVDDPQLRAAWERHPQLAVPYAQVLDTPPAAAWTSLSYGPFEQKAQLMFRLCDDLVEHGAVPERALRRTTEELNRLLAEYEAELGVTAPPATSTTVAPTFATVSGRVRCESGDPVVGIWIDSATGGSGWAERSDAEDGWTDFSAEVGTPFDYQLHVGCGGSSETWATSYFSEFLDADDQVVECLDGQGRRHGTCRAAAG